MAELNVRVNVDPGGAARQATLELAANVRRSTVALEEMAHQARLAGLRAQVAEVRDETDRLRAANERMAREMATSGSRWRETLTAVSSGYTAIRAAAQDVVSVVGRVAEGAVANERHELAVRRLGSAYNAVQAATNGVVTAEQALRLQQELVQSGLSLTTEQLAAAARRAREYAIATGTDLDQALGQMGEALRGGTAEGLRRFGVQVHEGTQRVDALRVATDQFQQMATRAQPAARTLGEEAAGASRAFSQMTDSILGSIARAINLRQVFADIRGFLGGFDEQREQNIGQIDSVNNRIMRSNQQTQFFNQVRMSLQRGEITPAQFDRIIAVGRTANSASLENMSIALSRGQGDRVYRGVVDSTVINVTGDPNAPQASRGGGGVGGGVTAGQRGELRRVAREWGYQQFGLTPEQRQQEAIDQANREADERGPAYEAARFAAGERTRESPEAATARGQRNAETAIRQLEEQERRVNSFGVQFQQRFRSIFGETQTMAQRAANIVGGAFESMTGAFRTHLAALIEGRETVGEALRGIVHETLLNLATESAVQALFQTAQGFAALATYRFPEAGQHFTAAGMYAGVAVAAGIGAAVTTAPTASAPAAGSGGLASQSPRVGAGGPEGAGGGSVTYVMNFSSAIVTKADAEDAVTRAAGGGLGRGVRIESVAQLQRARASR